MISFKKLVNSIMIKNIPERGIKEFEKALSNISTNLIINEEDEIYPNYEFQIGVQKFKIYSKENYIKRTKFCKQYETFLEVSNIDDYESLLKKNIKYFFKCEILIQNNKIIAHISHIVNYEKIIPFLENYNSIILKK